MNKNICKKCVYTAGANAFHREVNCMVEGGWGFDSDTRYVLDCLISYAKDFESQWHSGRFHCPCGTNRKETTFVVEWGTTNTADEPPKRCPYILEHVVCRDA